MLEVSPFEWWERESLWIFPTCENRHKPTLPDVLKPYQVFHSFLYGWNEQQCHLSVADKVRFIKNWTDYQIIPILHLLGQETFIRSLYWGSKDTWSEPIKEPTNAQNFTKLTYNYYFWVTWSEWRICMLRWYFLFRYPKVFRLKFITRVTRV